MLNRIALDRSKSKPVEFLHIFFWISVSNSVFFPPVGVSSGSEVTLQLM